MVIYIKLQSGHVTGKLIWLELIDNKETGHIFAKVRVMMRRGSS